MEPTTEQTQDNAPEQEAPKAPKIHKRAWAVTLTSNDKLGKDAQLLDPIASLRYVNTAAGHEREVFGSKEDATFFDEATQAYGLLDIILERRNWVADEATGRTLNGYEALLLATLLNRWNKGDQSEPGVLYSTNVVLAVHELHQIDDETRNVEEGQEQPRIWKVMGASASFNIQTSFSSVPVGVSV